MTECHYHLRVFFVCKMYNLSVTFHQIFDALNRRKLREIDILDLYTLS